MGKNKIQRTQTLTQAARRYVVAKQVEAAIEQHNFDKLVERGLVVAEPTGNPEIYDYDPEYTRPISMLKKDEGGVRERGVRSAISTTQSLNF